MRKIKVVMIGAGNMANQYLKVLTKNKKIELSGIFSRTFKKAEKLKKIYKIENNLNSIANLYNQTNADIVIVTVPGDHMLKITKKCMKFPWLIFIEKPPGLNFQEYNQLLNHSKVNKKKIYVGMNRRYFSSTINLKKKLTKLNGPRSIHIYDQQDTIAAKKKR